MAAHLAAGMLVAGNADVVSLGREYTLDSALLGTKLNVSVQLPEDYDKSEREYPVLYMLGSEYRARFAMAASTLDYLASQSQTPPLILVGLDLPEGNAVLIPRPEDEGGTEVPDTYLRVFEKELVPAVEAAFRTVPFRILYGASNAGLFALYAMAERPQIFDAYVASSPALWWSADLLRERLRGTFKPEAASGSGPGEPQKPVEPAATLLYLIYSDNDYGGVVGTVPGLVDLLEEEAPEWLRWSVEVRRGEGHVPAVDLPLALKAFFDEYAPATEFESYVDLRSYFDGLSARYGFRVPPPAELFFHLGFGHYRAEQYGAAEEVFRALEAEYPYLSRGACGLALVELGRGNAAGARGHVDRALAIDSESALARRIMARLEAGDRP